jgi:hypothetical protein
MRELLLAGVDRIIRHNRSSKAGTGLKLTTDPRLFCGGDAGVGVGVGYGCGCVEFQGAEPVLYR